MVNCDGEQEVCIRIVCRVTRKNKTKHDNSTKRKKELEKYKTLSNQRKAKQRECEK